jgi:hypothetical protein
MFYSCFSHLAMEREGGTAIQLSRFSAGSRPSKEDAKPESEKSANNPGRGEGVAQNVNSKIKGLGSKLRATEIW